MSQFKDALKFMLVCAAAILATMWLVSAAHAQHTFYPGQLLNPLIDYRYAGPPARDADGKIIRSREVVAAFQQIHPCPSTGLRYGECPDWSMDHVVSLGCGGVDAVWNLQWLHKSVKSAAARPGFFPKDRIERKVYGLDPPIPDTENCTFVTPERTLQ
jgi:hypothetical protein